jgi:5-oxopent-3-ene-1,2,5-tricarboxylate decarboxylase / 2-hydroxyhepta-2,4-diene-1,7-dioate isomerase
MKAGVVLADGRRTVTMPLGERWVDVSRAYRDYQREVEDRDVPEMRDLLDLIRAEGITRSFYRRITEFVQRHGRLEKYVLPDEPKFQLPWRPGKIIAIGRNYRAHVEEFDNQMPTEPIFFAKANSACIGPDEAIVIKPWYGRVDHEGELAVAIGKRAKDVRPEDALDYIAGYTLLNDVTARAMQKADIARGDPWFRSKSLDTFCPIGPVLVFPEVLSWPLEVDIEVAVNGEIRQKSNTAKFIFDLPTLMAHVTRHITLEAGDVISTGTPEGVSPLNPGDIVEVRAPGIGLLRNPVAGE